MSKKDIIKLIFKLILAIICGIAISLVLLAIFIWCFQDRFLFHPSFDQESFNILRDNNSFEEIIIKENDFELHGWIKRNTNKEVAPLVIYFGGNAQNSSSTFNYFETNETFKYFDSYNVLYVDYPGYGLSVGNPTSTKLLESGLTIYDYASKLEYVDKDNIIIFGFSIGTGVATYVSSLRDVNGLILLAPYDELINMYNDTINIFYGPFKLLVRHNIKSYIYAKDVKTNPLIIASEDDTIINSKHALSLVEHFNTTYDVVIEKGFGHNEFLTQQIVLDNIYNYLQSKLI